jgi:hypothetical protein
MRSDGVFKNVPQEEKLFPSLFAVRHLGSGLSIPLTGFSAEKEIDRLLALNQDVWFIKCAKRLLDMTPSIDREAAKDRMIASNGVKGVRMPPRAQPVIKIGQCSAPPDAPDKEYTPQEVGLLCSALLCSDHTCMHSCHALCSFLPAWPAACHAL